MNKNNKYVQAKNVKKIRRNYMDILKKICLVLIIIGAINWAFVGLFELDLVASIFGGSDALLAKIIYIIIGIAGLIDISMLFDRD